MWRVLFGAGSSSFKCHQVEAEQSKKPLLALDPGPEGKNAKKRITEAIDEIGVWTADLIKPWCQC